MKELLDKLFKDNKKRHLWTFVVIIPFVVAIGLCGFLVCKEAKEKIAMINGNSSSVDDSHMFYDGNFILRENATKLQEEYFNELKEIYLNPDELMTDEAKAICTAKNFIADFYTWSNKYGQYDVGGIYYLYEPQKETIYIQARDQFYKYLNEYIDNYGSDSLLEVEMVDTKLDGEKFSITCINDDTGEEEELDAYKIIANWSYVQKEGNFDSSKFENKCCLLVINRYGRFEVAYSGTKPYEVNKEDIETNEEA